MQRICCSIAVSYTHLDVYKRQLVYCGDGRNNVANSLLVTGAILGVNVHIFSPKELFPEKEIVELAEGFAKESGAHILITEDADEAVKGADVLYTDVWVCLLYTSIGCDHCQKTQFNR